jgi:hypothetical protein
LGSLKCEVRMAHILGWQVSLREALEESGGDRIHCTGMQAR